jgi:hypothetical protein
MVTKASRKSRTSRVRQKPTKSGSGSKGRKADKQKAEKTAATSDRFVKDLLVRGEAMKPDKQGKLQLDATHAITKEEKDGTVIVKRARFKYF